MRLIVLWCGQRQRQRSLSQYANQSIQTSSEVRIAELEKELAKALKEDDFEKAGDINDLLKELKNPPGEEKED